MARAQSSTLQADGSAHHFQRLARFLLWRRPTGLLDVVPPQGIHLDSIYSIHAGTARPSARGCHFHRHAGEPPSRAGLEVRFVPGQVHHLVQRYIRLPGLDRTSARSLISAGRTRASSRSEIRGHDTQLSVPTCPAPARTGLAAPGAASERSRATPMPSRSMPQQTWSASDRC